jgi:vitamin K-dependent gamma-carboxylase-like protein
VRDLARRWNRWWFDPVSTSTLGAVRIAFGAVLLVWTLTLAPDLRAFYTASGVVPSQPGGSWTWGVLGVSSSMPVVVAVFAALVIGSVGVLIGYRTRLSLLLVFVALMSFERRDPYVFNTGDWVLRMLAFYLMLSPAGAALSVDRWRRHRDRFWEAPLRAPWVVRLIQLQLSAGYLFAVWAKVQGTTWNDGTAVYYALHIGDFARFHVPHAIAASALLSNVFTYGALATEISMAFLVWNRRARPWVLLAGVAMHLLIDATLLVGFFSYEMFVAYIAFVPEPRMDAFVDRVRRRLTRARPVPAAVPVTAAPLVTSAAPSERDPVPSL